jgi:hypothetical protein
MDATVSEHEMCNEFEAMFVRLERDARQAEPLVASVTDKVGRDVQFLATPLPCLALISADLQELLEGDAAQGDRNAAAYLDFQERSFAGVAIANRPPRDEDELEFVELMLFCFLRSKCFREIFGVADPIHKRIDKFSVRRKPRDEVTLRELRKLCDIDGLKCEFAPELTEVATTPSAGTALYIFLDYNDVLLVEPNREVPDKSLVAFALQANYTECIINKQKFKLLLQFEGPFSRMKVPLAFRDRAVCQAVASAIHKQSRMWGFYSQQLVRSFIFGPVVTEDA